MISKCRILICGQQNSIDKKDSEQMNVNQSYLLNVFEYFRIF